MKLFKFPVDMYVSPVGSYVISCFLLSGGDKSDVTISGLNARWKAAVKKNKHFDIFDLRSIADYFHVPYILEPIAMVQSKCNVVYLPYDGEKLYPIREDGFVTQTMTTGKIYPLKDGGESK